MPDVLKKTVSASQVAALFNRSPYQTRWSLWQWFRQSIDIDDANRRMDFGKFVEPFVLSQVQERLRLEVLHNREGAYFRNGDLGCTRDARVFDPTRGEGIVQAKCHSYQAWREAYTDSMTPPHVEMQLQTEMFVHGAKWGVVAVMVGQNDQLLLYERQPIPALQEKIRAEAHEFLDSVMEDREPDVLGAAVELPVLDLLYPTVRPKTIATVDPAKVESIAEAVRMYAWAKEQEAFHRRVKDDKRAIIAAAVGEAERMELPGVTVRVKRSQTKASVMALPADLAIGLTKTISTLPEGVDIEPLKAAATWNIQTRAPSVRTEFEVITTEEQQQESTQWLTP